jgi:hypothetical protein
MTEAITVLEQAWAIAYKEIGKDGGNVSTIDMITGACTGSCWNPVSCRVSCSFCSSVGCVMSASCVQGELLAALELCWPYLSDCLSRACDSPARAPLTYH